MKSLDRSSRNEAELLLGSEAYRVLLQIALLGAELGDAQMTLQMAEVMQRLRPDLPHARAVQAMALLTLGQRDAAVRELEVTLEHFPDFQLGKALLGVFLKISGRSGWQNHLDAVIDDGRDEFAVGMACEVMDRPRAWTGTTAESGPEMPDAPPPAHVVWA